jgi:hypothetical protein
MKTPFLFLIALAVLVLASAGCDIGINPLLFDGSPLTATFPVNTSGTSYSGAETVNLMDALSDITDDVDSVDVINITIQAVNTGETPSGTSISGTAYFNETTLFTMDSLALSTLSSEQSIFSLPTSSITLNRPGVRVLRNEVKDIVRHPERAHIVTVGVSGSSTGSPLQLQISLRLYTQVFTKAKK